jgi:hypothetical protein
VNRPKLSAIKGYRQARFRVKVCRAASRRDPLSVTLVCNRASD